MKAQKDRHPEAPGEANRDKHINFPAAESGDIDPADETFSDDENNDVSETSEVDNGIFADDDSDETKENKKERESSAAHEKIIPVAPDAAQTINDSVPDEGDNNNASIQGSGNSSLKKQDNQAH